MKTVNVIRKGNSHKMPRYLSDTVLQKYCTILLMLLSSLKHVLA